MTTNAPDVDCRMDAAAGGHSDQRLVRRPLPPEVVEIFKEVARYQYELLTDAGWCVSCYRERNNGTKRCNECAEKWRLRQEARNRIAGNKPWRSGKRGRPPKSANDKLCHGAEKTSKLST